MITMILFQMETEKKYAAVLLFLALKGHVISGLAAFPTTQAGEAAK